MGTRWYRKRNRPQNENYISNGQKSVKSKAFKESVRVVGSKLFACKFWNLRSFLTLNESLFSMIFSLDLNGISPQTISNSKTPSDQVAADLNRMLLVCSI